MTVNQLIVLLDVYRGFTPDAHTGTLTKDCDYLVDRGLIRVMPDRQVIETTDKGEELVDLLKRIGSL